MKARVIVGEQIPICPFLQILGLESWIKAYKFIRLGIVLADLHPTPCFGFLGT
jgi:hypothetical protein